MLDPSKGFSPVSFLPQLVSVMWPELVRQRRNLQRQQGSRGSGHCAVRMESWGSGRQPETQISEESEVSGWGRGAAEVGGLQGRAKSWDHGSLKACRSWRKKVADLGQQKHSRALSSISNYHFPRAVELSSYELRNPHFLGLLESCNACIFLAMDAFVESIVLEGTTCFFFYLPNAPVARHSYYSQTLRTQMLRNTSTRKASPSLPWFLVSRAKWPQSTDATLTMNKCRHMGKIMTPKLACGMRFDENSYNIMSRIGKIIM